MQVGLRHHIDSAIVSIATHIKTILLIKDESLRLLLPLLLNLTDLLGHFREISCEHFVK